jgi:hypothetical protein
MIPTEVYIQYLRKQLESQKTPYDYLQLILPIASGFILAIAGWLFGFIQNRQNTMFQLKKEQYYRSRESMAKIVTLFSEYSTYVYNFIKITKNTFNNRFKLDHQMLDDFITENQMKLALIHQMIRIEFPLSNTGIKEINEEAKNFEIMFNRLDNIQAGILEGGIVPEVMAKEIDEIHKNTNRAIDEVTKKMSEVEIEIIKTLENEAITLKIVKKKENRKR